MAGEVLRTRRLGIRPFVATDLDAVHRILDEALGDGSRVHDPAAREDRRSWLEWSSLNQRWLPRLHQPPFGDRAVVLTETGEVIGTVGLIALLDRYEKIPELRLGSGDSGLCTPEVGLFWAITREYRGRGFASESAQALSDFAFDHLRVRRLLATARNDNLPAQGVMRKLGMLLFRNPEADPPWLEVVGVLENPATRLERRSTLPPPSM